MVPLSMTLSDRCPGFPGHDIFRHWISQKRRFNRTKSTTWTKPGHYLSLWPMASIPISRWCNWAVVNFFFWGGNEKTLELEHI